MKSVFLCLVLFLTCGFIDDTSFGTRGGGSGVRSEIRRLGNEIFTVLLPDRTITVQGQNIDLAPLQSIFNDALFEVKSDLRIGNGTVDAINYPRQNVIEINRDTWIFLELNVKRQLILHELLGLARINDSDYRVSEALLSKFRALSSATPSECGVERYSAGIEAFTIYSLLKKFVNSKNEVPPIEQVTCITDPWQNRTRCKSTNNAILHSPADNELLLGILKSMGIAPTSANGVTEVYTARTIKCLASPYADSYECIVVADWLKSCP
ncbi:hypothetical protein [Bdellovibrio sp. GT3]|uniref:hypothetical protein n=1 Tax=Bdellovibrio sp. GT3 TaxID=3136282 RepID=UPI0030F2E705